MHAEVMAIGDELTSGQRLDTNSQWLSRELEQIGIPVGFHATVGDDLSRMTAAIQTAVSRASVVLITGGLGPTADDLTRQAIAQAAGVQLVRDDDALRHIERLFSQRNRVMPAANQIQAMFPQGSRVIPNPHGTAPGIDIQFKSSRGQPTRLMALPGVPAEMREMWFQTVRPALVEWIGVNRIICHHRIKCFGVGESQLEEMLPDLIRRGQQPRVGITVHRATITLRITAEGPDEPTCRRQMEPTIQTIRECLGDLVFGEEDDELQHAVICLLARLNMTLAVAEWGTRGVLSRWLGELEQSAGTLKGGLVIRDAGSLGAVANDDIARPAKGNAPHTAQLLAERVREIFQADYGLSVSDVPDLSAEAPRIYLGLAGPHGTKVHSKSYIGHPDILVERAAKQAMDMLRRELFELVVAQAKENQ